MKEPHNRLYDSVRWRKVRQMVLNEEPLCRMCLSIKRTTPATVVDHVKPHKNDMNLFYDRDNLQALCAPCHDSAKQMQERHGYSQGCDANGYPLDADHPWGVNG